MRDKFRAYYPPTPEEFRQLWEQGLFVFDANILLNVYRWGGDTRDRFFTILGKLGDRIWVPHQAALEYHRRRCGVISNEFKAYGAIQNTLEKAKREIESGYHRHPYIDLKNLLGTIDQAFQQVFRQLEEAKARHPKALAQDDLMERITGLFAGRTGDSYPDARLEEIHKEAAERFKVKCPPGYMDEKDKARPMCYGDVVLWFQVIDHAQQTDRPIVFVCDDAKEDWWERQSGEEIGKQTLGPRRELKEEFYERTGGRLFHMYSGDQFIYRGGEHFRLVAEQKAVEEAKEIGRLAKRKVGVRMTPERHLRALAERVLIGYSKAPYRARADLAGSIARRVMGGYTSPPTWYHLRKEEWGLPEFSFLLAKTLEGVTDSYRHLVHERFRSGVLDGELAETAPTPDSPRTAAGGTTTPE